MTLEQMCTAIAEAGKGAMAAGNRRDLFEKAIKEVKLLRANAIRQGSYFGQNPVTKRKAKKARERADRRVGQLVIAMKNAGFVIARAIPGYKAGKLPTNALTLTQLGLTKEESKRSQALARMTDEEFELWLDRPRAKRTTATRQSSPAGPKSIPSPCPASLFPIGSGHFD